MKNIKLFILFLAVLVVATSCADREDFDDLASADYKWVGLTSPESSNTSVASIFEGNGSVPGFVTITVSTGGALTNDNNIDVAIEFSGEATFGEDFVIVDASNVSNVSTKGMTVTIPADTLVTSFQVQTITNVELESDRSVALEIVSNSMDYAIGYPRKQALNLIILDDDCEFILEDDFTGANETNENSVGLFGENGPYDANVTIIEATTLSIGNVFDFGWEVLAVLNPADNTLSISSQGPFSALSCGAPITDWFIEGTGQLSPCTTAIALDLDVSSVAACDGDGFAFQLLMDIDFTN